MYVNQEPTTLPLVLCILVCYIIVENVTFTNKSYLGVDGIGTLGLGLGLVLHIQSAGVGLGFSFG